MTSLSVHPRLGEVTLSQTVRPRGAGRRRRGTAAVRGEGASVQQTIRAMEKHHQ